MSIKNTLRKGTVEMLTLHLLSLGDMYGYRLRQYFDKLSNGEFIVTDASLYPTLYRLVKKGLISERIEQHDLRKRKYYHIEQSGIDYLEESLREYRILQDAVDMVLAE